MQFPDNKKEIKAIKGVLLVNLGTPDSYSTDDVRKYLREFLMDKRVIDIPFFSRFLLVNGIIAPFRAPKSAALYQQLWEDRGSPLKFYAEDLCTILRKKLGEKYLVTYAMRYQNPSIKSVLNELSKSNIKQILLLPLFPQYASATTGSVVEKVFQLIGQQQNIPSIHYISQFYQHPLFIQTIKENAENLIKKQQYEHFVFSYHGIPERQIHKASTGYCQLNNCCNQCQENNQFCYRSQCFHTTRLLVDTLGLKKGEYTTCFQSRLGKDSWIQPYAEATITELAQKGVKKILAFSPAFVADCLETSLEVGEEFKEEFISQGGEVWDLVPSLNASPTFASCLTDIIEKQI